MKEAQLQAAVIDLAHVYGWKVAHFRPAQNSRGDWFTPVAADGKGFPDLVLVSSSAVLFVELKSKAGRLTPEQNGWINGIFGAGGDSRVWRPDDWTGGVIEQVLRDMR